MTSGSSLNNRPRSASVNRPHSSQRYLLSPRNFSLSANCDRHQESEYGPTTEVPKNEDAILIGLEAGGNPGKPKVDTGRLTSRNSSDRRVVFSHSKQWVSYASEP